MTRTLTPYLLAVDTSSHTIGLALYNGVQVASELVWTSQDYHTVELAPALADLLARRQIGVKDLSAVGVAIGPGSFTGLRIGLALAKGLVLAQKLPLIGIPTLDVLAAAQPVSANTLAAVLHAGRGRLAVGWYKAEDREWRPAAPIEVLTPQDLAERIQSNTLVCGELDEEERHLLSRRRAHSTRANIWLASPAQSLRRPSYLAELAWQRWQSGLVDDPTTLSPIYLHYNDPIPG
jgi:tRNA threonylcarbamoyladenosine biosynthesis protein TsaB